MGVIDGTHPAGAAAAALAVQATVTAKLAAFMTRYDVLLTPTLAGLPLPIGATALKWHERLVVGLLVRLPVAALAQAMLVQIAGDTFAWAGMTELFNLTGQPAMSVPLWWNAEGLPIGVQLVGRASEDAGLFRLAGQLERARPWADRRPPAG